MTLFGSRGLGMAPVASISANGSSARGGTITVGADATDITTSSAGPGGSAQVAGSLTARGATDGGRIVTSLLPHKLAYQFARIEPYGFFIVLALIYFKILNFWVVPVAVLTETFLHLILSPLSFLLN